MSVLNACHSIFSVEVLRLWCVDQQELFLSSHTFNGAHGSDKCVEVLVEESASVNSLKKAIQAEKLTITCDANEMQLFLAKKSGAWLTEAYVNDGVSDTNDLKPSQHRHDWRR
ncbi:hypothetical protein F442_01340 [Phytophthora nicotianae P10297]|uniref:Crinkler effector protein N-terminal domain-containing protein n=1 Tax=Phytophthora nicotianae P10297 TaxID=1317064 RepID=W3A3J8_PHYNI|nr:hypothetical protein F442_01340 [Phytophthora nicotianae P10297]